MNKTALLASAAVYSLFSFIYINDMNIKKADNLVNQKDDLEKVRQLSHEINKCCQTNDVTSEDFNALISASALKYCIADKNIRLSCQSLSDKQNKYTLQLKSTDLNKSLACLMEIEKKSGRAIKNMNIRKITENENMYLSIRVEFVI